ncbi:MAG: ImmA/IrrE family metallo-endopeptidase [Lachnospiraceae bacterium]|nr:ImmA/IrrE family metallo-endopeptidase [Lachnospiraceae bacterium]
MEKMQIEKKAIELMNEINYRDEQEAIDIIQIAKNMGFAIGNAILDDDDDGFIIVKEGEKEILGIKTDKLIGVNSARTLEWKRFIIAHEIAHYRLHYSSNQYKGMYAHRDHKKGKNDIENDADYFAANLLMPREKFSEKFKEFKKMGLDYEEIVLLLARKFVVTSKMIERRIGELELNG